VSRLSCFHSLLSSSSQWAACFSKMLVGGHSWDSWSKLVAWNEMKAQVKEEEEVIFVVMEIFFPNNYYTCWHAAFQEMAKHLTAMGSSDWIPLSALLACASFALAVKRSLSQSLSLLLFHFLPVPQETRIKERVCGCLAVGQVSPPQRLSYFCCLSMLLSPSAFANPCSLMLR